MATGKKNRKGGEVRVDERTLNNLTDRTGVVKVVGVVTPAG